MLIEMQHNSNNLVFASSAYPPHKKDGIFTNNEPISVLDTWSPSPSTSTSTSTAARGGGGKEEWVADLPPSVCENADNHGVEDWDYLGKQYEILKTFQCFDGFALNKSSEFSLNNEGNALQCLPPYMAFPQELELPSVNQFHLPQLSNYQQRQFVYDDVYKAAELIGAGNFANAQGILARLNHFFSPIGKTPFLRSAFYVKEALELALTMPQRITAPFDHATFKMGAYKVFSQVSPVIHFMNFTGNQLLLEALGGCDKIHIIDFDIGFGAHWSSFLQEIACLNRGVVTSVKITAFASPSTHHSFEISLMHENLTELANGLGINFELEVVNVDCFDPNCNSVSCLRSSESEVIAVNFPLWSFTTYLSALPSYLCLLKRLSPKILVSLGRGCECIDLPFSHHILHTLEYYEALLDSVDAANVTSDALTKIERLHLQPRIESTVWGRFLCPNVMPTWRNLFASVGYYPVSISNFAETQAQCLLKRMHVKGFCVERKEASLLLCWKRCELLSVSAWKC